MKSTIIAVLIALAIWSAAAVVLGLAVGMSARRMAPGTVAPSSPPAAK